MVDPQLCKRLPEGNTYYHQYSHVYPILALLTPVLRGESVNDRARDLISMMSSWPNQKCLGFINQLGIYDMIILNDNECWYNHIDYMN